LQFFDGDRNLKTFGSRGEQRMLILILKLKTLEYIEEKRGEKPILLLDDIFSELDLANRNLALNLIANRQTIITTADEKDLADLQLGDYQKIYLKP
jgi:DNA replication and repair protein RecF